jgi:H+/Cl- antiporter ClcA
LFLLIRVTYIIDKAPVAAQTSIDHQQVIGVTMKATGKGNPALPAIRSALVNGLQQHAALLVGALSVGIVSFGYARLIDLGYARFQAFHASHPLGSLTVVPCVAALVTWITRSQFAGAEGSGIPQVIAAVQSKDDRTSSRLLSLRVLAGKIAMSFLAALGGLTIGREGPTIQMGAALMLHAKSLFPRTRVTDQQLMLAGGAAGLAAAFNAPLAGFVFAIEQLARRYDARTSVVIMAGVALAAMAGICLGGNHSSLPRVDSEFPFQQWAPAILVCGLIAGLSGGALAWLFANIPRWLPAPLGRLRAQRPVVFAALCGVVVSVAGLASGGASFGSGFGQAGAMLQGHSPPLIYSFAKAVSLGMSFVAGIPGGIFSPTLAIGAGLGSLAHCVFGGMPLPLLAILSMGGFLAGVTRTPVMSFIAVAEMTGAYQLVVPLMATALIASRLSRLFGDPLYQVLSARYRAPIVRSGASRS